MNVSIGARTDTGERDHNEDAVLVFQGKGCDLGADALIVVADGMGGRAAGEEASNIAVEAVRDTVKSLLKPSPDMPDYEEALQTAMRRANSAVYDYARSSPSLSGMGATCIAAIIGKDSVAIAHIGDSRAYLLRDGLLRRLTEDHSYVHDQIKSGRLSDHDARNSRFRHVITRAVGIEPIVKADISSHRLEDGDSILICTDGLSNIVDETGMIQIMSRARTAQDAVDYLVDAAKRGGSKDNITGALARIGGWSVKDAPYEQKEIVKAADTKNVKKKPRFARSSSRQRKAIFIVSVLAALILGIVGGYFFRTLTPARSKTPTSVLSPFPSHFNANDYSAPHVLLDKTLSTGFLAGTSNGILVKDATSGDLLSVASNGQIRVFQKASAKPSASTPTTVGAVDSAGRLFLPDSASHSIKCFSADGSILGSIALPKNLTVQSITASGNGDLYLLCSGKLNVLRIQNAPTGKSNVSREGR
jgi:protein phosphatase